MVLLEIEQKFNWTLPKFHLLQHQTPHPLHPLPSIKNLTHTQFRDTYYDTSKHLSTNNLWVRKRHPLPGPPKWQAKQSQGPHSFLRATYEETENPIRILEMVRQHFPLAPGSEHDFGLGQICEFGTSRYEFLADGRFGVVLDETDFGHRVGEVEVLAEDAVGAHAEIEGFLGRYGWVFERGVGVKGKLTAYFERFGYPGES